MGPEFLISEEVFVPRIPYEFPTDWETTIRCSAGRVSELTWIPACGETTTSDDPISVVVRTLNIM